MSSEEAIQLTASIEKVALVACPLLLAFVWLLARRYPPGPGHDGRPAQRVTRGELTVLLVVLAGALLLRLLWWDRGLPGTIFGGELITARVDLAVQRGGLWARWWEQLRSPNIGGWQYDSPIVEPVVVAFEWFFPPQIHGIVRVGAFFGVLGVALAWFAGRVLHGPRFALLFAAMIAVAPLQVVWSRLGYRAMAATPHVLLTMGVAALAGRRGSLVLAALAGALGYLTIFSYELARAAIPLSVLALWTATRAPVRRNGRFAMLTLVLAASFVLLLVKLPRAGWRSMIWPTYAGYVGNQGEQSLSELVTKNSARIEFEAQRSLGDYFIRNRNSPPRPPAWTWGIASGGLTFLPMIVLGGVGLLYGLARPSVHLVWFATLAIGLALPALGCTSARRLLVFDIGWCAFAALGLMTLSRLPIVRRLPSRPSVTIAGAFFVAIGAWTLAAITILSTGPSVRGMYSLPFGSGCVGDISTCPRCVEAAREWERDIHDGDLVMLVDSDMTRENPTAPGGLSLYGYLAADKMERRDRFQELYPILGNSNFIPEFRHYFATDALAFLRDLLTKTSYRNVVWHSERPNAWDRWFGRSLESAGGTTTSFPTPLGTRPGFRTVTAKSQEAAVLRGLSSLASASATSPSCVSARPARTDPLPFQPNALAPVPARQGPPAWIGLWWDKAFVGNTVWPMYGARNIVVETRDGTSMAHVIRSDGFAETVPWPARAPSSVRQHPELLPIGRGCAVRAGGGWWVVDPEMGSLKSQLRQDWIPSSEWIGIASDGDQELVLAAADQKIVVVDLGERRVKFQFPATVTPTRFDEFGECSAILRGTGWIGTYQAFANRLDLYADPGTPLGSLDLRALGLPWVRTVAAQGNFVAAGTPAQTITTLELDFARCPAGS